MGRSPRENRAGCDRGPVGRRPTGWLTVVVPSLALACAAGPQGGGAMAPAAAPAAQTVAPRHLQVVEEAVLQGVAEERRKRRLPSLRPDPALAAIARDHSADMLRRGYFAHESPDGIGPAERVHRGHRELIGLPAENLWSGAGFSLPRSPGAGARVLARTIVGAWMESPRHRKNLLQSGFTHVGIGVASDGAGSIRVTQVLAEVWGYLRTPLPSRIRPGASLDLPMELEAATAAPRLLAFEGPGGGRSEPAAVTGAQAPGREGRYQLLLYFPIRSEDRRYRVVPGPFFEVRGRAVPASLTGPGTAPTPSGPPRPGRTLPGAPAPPHSSGRRAIGGRRGGRASPPGGPGRAPSPAPPGP